jgi:hypothetical protein
MFSFKPVAKALTLITEQTRSMGARHLRPSLKGKLHVKKYMKTLKKVNFKKKIKKKRKKDKMTKNLKT